MGSKAIVFLGLFLAIALLIASEVTARELAETSTSTQQTNGVDDATYEVDGHGGRYNHGGHGGYHRGGHKGGKGGHGGHGPADEQTNAQVDGRGGYNRGGGKGGHGGHGNANEQN